VTIRINDKADAPGISSLFTRVFIEEEGANSDGDAGSPAFLSWKYEKRASGSPLSLAALDEEGRVIGHTGAVFQAARGPRGPFLAALNVDSAVDGEHRTLSAYLGLMKRAIAEAKAAGAGLMYTHANGNAQPIMIKALRFKPLFAFKAFICVPRGVRGGRPLYAPALWAAALILDRAPLAGGTPEPEELNAFPAGFKAVDSFIGLSDDEYQARFFDCPTRGYGAWLSRSGPGPGGDAAYAVVGKWKRPLGQPAFLVLSVFRKTEIGELSPEPDDEAAARARALRRLARALRSPLIALSHEAQLNVALAKKGFIDATGGMERFLGGGVAVLGLPLDGADWSAFRCSLGDIDS
jgi:hypothetical protein